MSGASVRLGAGPSRAVAGAVATTLTLGCVVAVSALSSGDRVDTTSVVLGCAAVVAGWLVAGERDGLSVSGSFIVYALAGAFLGPRSAIAAAVISELTAAVRMRTR